jgi:hypothetical protein
VNNCSENRYGGKAEMLLITNATLTSCVTQCKGGGGNFCNPVDPMKLIVDSK